MNDDTPPELEPDATLITVIIGAWKEALTASGVKRIILVPIVAVMTIPFWPIWLALILLEAIGLYDLEKGFTLPP